MKDKIQQLIQWAEVREKAFSACTKVFVTESAKFKSIGRLEENAFWKQQLMLLLSDKPTVAITETAHCANTLLSECAESKDGQVIGDVGAGSSETEIVKQNEQTKELCKHQWIRGYRAFKCNICGELMSTGL